MMSQTPWKVPWAAPTEIEANPPWLDQQVTGIGTALPGRRKVARLLLEFLK
jgi:hypothetical protein